jgi:hypothetical protein
VGGRSCRVLACVPGAGRGSQVSCTPRSVSAALQNSCWPCHSIIAIALPQHCRGTAIAQCTNSCWGRHASERPWGSCAPRRPAPPRPRAAPPTCSVSRLLGWQKLWMSPALAIFMKCSPAGRGRDAGVCVGVGGSRVGLGKGCGALPSAFPLASPRGMQGGAFSPWAQALAVQGSGLNRLLQQGRRGLAPWVNGGQRRSKPPTCAVLAVAGGAPAGHVALGHEVLHNLVGRPAGGPGGGV